MKRILQLLGVASLTAGAVLFFVQTDAFQASNTNDPTTEITQLQDELANVKEALADAQQSSKADSKDDKTKVKEKEKQPSSNDASKEAKSEEGSNDDAPIVKMILTLSTGDSSSDASNSLEKSGIIKSASEFENYLNQKGLSGKIQIGQHEVDEPITATKRHRGLGPVGGEGHQTLALSTSKDDGQNLRTTNHGPNLLHAGGPLGQNPGKSHPGA